MNDLRRIEGRIWQLTTEKVRSTKCEVRKAFRKRRNRSVFNYNISEGPDIWQLKKYKVRGTKYERHSVKRGIDRYFKYNVSEGPDIWQLTSDNFSIPIRVYP